MPQLNKCSNRYTVGDTELLKLSKIDFFRGYLPQLKMVFDLGKFISETIIKAHSQ